MDTPIYEQVREWVSRTYPQDWPTVDLDPSEPWELPTARHFPLPPETFIDWPPVEHDREVHADLFCHAVVESTSRERAA